jgi:hypothetical protein
VAAEAVDRVVALGAKQPVAGGSPANDRHLSLLIRIGCPLQPIAGEPAPEGLTRI